MNGRATRASTSARSLLLSRRPGATGVLVELGVIVVVLVANLAVRWLTLDDLAVAVSNAHDVLALEEAWRLDWEHAAQDAVRAEPWLGTVGAWFYVWGYLPVVALALAVLFVRRPTDYARLRNALLAGGVVGLAVYLLYPLAPPRLTDLGYADPIATSVVEPSARPVGIANEIAAMPSFHVGYIVVVAVVVFRLTDSVLVRAWCVVHPLLMCWVVVATGNHWVLDLPAGVAIAGLGLWVADRIARSADAGAAG
jgi:hypothetical protein